MCHEDHYILFLCLEAKQIITSTSSLLLRYTQVGLDCKRILCSHALWDETTRSCEAAAALTTRIGFNEEYLSEFYNFLTIFKGCIIVLSSPYSLGFRPLHLKFLEVSQAIPSTSFLDTSSPEFDLSNQVFF